jgi:hypothetical protein
MKTTVDANIILEEIVKVNGRCSLIANYIFTCSQCPLGTPKDHCKTLDEYDQYGESFIYGKRLELAKQIQKLKYIEGL